MLYRNLILSLLLLCCQSIFAQSGECIYKNGEKFLRCTTDYAPPGESGENVLWNFETLSIENDEFYNEYIIKDSITIIEITPYCNNYYKYKSDTLYCIGYSTSNVELEYIHPEIHQIHSMPYGNSHATQLYGEGKYSGTLNMCLYGEQSYKIDAYGTIILPGDSTRYNAFRTHRQKHIGQKMSPHADILSHNTAEGQPKYIINNKLEHDSLTWHICTYDWFVPGYKHPVIETTETYLLVSGVRTLYNATSVYYPIYGQEQIVTTDCNTDTLQRSTSYTHRDLLSTTRLADINQNKDIILTCSHNRDGNLLVKINTGKHAEARVILTNAAGVIYEQAHVTLVGESVSETVFNTDGFPKGVYLLTVCYGEKTICKKIYLGEIFDENK